MPSDARKALGIDGSAEFEIEVDRESDSTTLRPVVTVRREGRSMIYAARYETMNALIAYLTENCCRGRPEQCLPAKKENAPRKTRKPHRAQIAEPVS